VFVMVWGGGRGWGGWVEVGGWGLRWGEVVGVRCGCLVFVDGMGCWEGLGLVGGVLCGWWVCGVCVFGVLVGVGVGGCGCFVVGLWFGGRDGR